MDAYYEILGLTREDATIDDVRSSYFAKARLFHPDKNPSHKEWAEQKFVELKTAYDAVYAEAKSSRRLRRPDWRRNDLHRESDDSNGGTVLIIHSKRDSNSDIYNAVTGLVEKYTSSCAFTSVDDVARAVKNSFCTICLLTPNFLQDYWCDVSCTTACEIAVERGTPNVFWVKTVSFRNTDIPAALKGISGISFPHFAFDSSLRKTLKLLGGQ